MDMLRADLGADAAEHEALMAQVEANQIPYPEPTPEQIAAEAKAKLREIDLASIRAIREGDTVRMAEWEQKAALIRAAL
jgi:hypothetical protein